MPTQKRRVIYMADEQWERLKEIAGQRTISEMIREQFFDPSPVPLTDPDRGLLKYLPIYADLDYEPARDEDLNVTVKVEPRFNSRGPRPVPKG